MAIDEDKIKLLLELIGFSDIDTAIASMDHLKGAAVGVQGALDTVTTTTAQTGKAFQQIEPYLTQADADFEDLLRTTLETTQAQKAMAAALEDVKVKQVSTNASLLTTKITLGDYRQNMTGLGYVVNDFASVQGDLSQRLNATANNLPMLLAGFGGLGLALSGLVPILGIVIKNWDHIKDAFNGTEPIVKTTGTLDEMKESLKGVNKELETLATARFDSLANAERYNKLTADQLALEKNITAEKEKQAQWDKIKDLRPKAESKEAAAKAKALKDSVGGDQNTLAEIVQRTIGTGKLDAIGREIADLQKQLEAAPKHAEMESGYSAIQAKLESDIAEAEARQQQEQARIQAEARGIVGKAIGQGDAEAFRKMQEAVEAEAAQAAVAGKPDANLEKLRTKLARATPEGRQQQAEVAAEAEQALEEQYLESMKERADTAEMLNEQGKEHQKAMERTEKEEQEIANNLAAVQQDLAKQRQQFPHDLEKGKADFDRAVDQWQNRVGREGKQAVQAADPDRMLQTATAQQIQAATGANDGQALEMAQRSLQLQKQGWDAMNATQQAQQEMMAAMNGMGQQYQMLQRRAAMMSAEIRRQAARNAVNDNTMPAMQFGWPG